MTLSAIFEQAVGRGADRDFIHVPMAAARGYCAAPITWTYGQAAERVRSLRDAYAAAGFGPGHRVALALDNRADFFLHLLALNGLGTSIVPLNGGMTRDELRYVLTHSDAALAVTHEGHEAHLRQALPPDCPLVSGAEPGRLAAPPRPGAAGA